MKRAVTILSVFAFFASSIQAQVTFQDLDTLACLDDEAYLRGISWVDVDNDGDLDVSFSGNSGTSRGFENKTGIFINQGNNHFENTGLISSDQQNQFGHSWADMNNDGFPDLYI